MVLYHETKIMVYKGAIQMKTPFNSSWWWHMLLPPRVLDTRTMWQIGSVEVRQLLCTRACYAGSIVT